MKSSSETGHYKIVVNFKTLKMFATELGVEYKPQKETLKLTFLETLLIEATKAHDDVKEQLNANTLAVDSRQSIFENIKPFGTKIINMMGSTNVAAKTIEDAKSINAKIQGTRIAKKGKDKPTPEKTEEENAEESKSISVSRQSFDSFYENFKSLNNLLTQDGNYAPEDQEFNLAALTAKENEMLAANETVKTGEINIGKKRINRDNLFYTTDNSVIEVAKGVKKYIRGKYGVTSSEFALIKKLSFPDLSKRNKK
jgi:hypothetical protein